MRVTLLSALERTGGAARATQRLYRALRAAGVPTALVVHRTETEDPGVVGLDRRFGPLSFHLPYHADRLATRLPGPGGGQPWTAAPLGRSLARALAQAPCDVAHLHWTGYGFLRPETLASARRPLVWTLHDQWAFCGGEHYPRTQRYERGYGPEDAPRGLDVDRWLFRRKRRAYARVPSLTLVAPSRWMRDCARRSVLLGDRPVEVIPNAVDTSVFKPLDRSCARVALNLPLDRPLAFVSAVGVTSDPRKGWALLEQALARLSAAGTRLELLVAGVDRGPALPVPAHYLGFLQDEVSLAMAYAAADVFVCPSLQDNLPNTVVEALACGIPCAAFDVGGLGDLVTHQQDGVLARAGDAGELAAGIAWILAEAPRHRLLARAARAGAERRFAPDVVAGLHAALYERVLAGARSQPPLLS